MGILINILINMVVFILDPLVRLASYIMEFIHNQGANIFVFNGLSSHGRERFRLQEQRMSAALGRANRVEAR